jgi:hypothetical protein
MREGEESEIEGELKNRMGEQEGEGVGGKIKKTKEMGEGERVRRRI